MVVASNACWLNLRPTLISWGLFGVAAFLIFLNSQARAETAPQLRLDGQTDRKPSADAAREFVFGTPASPGTGGFSPYTPVPTQYLRFDEMDKGDRRLALAQVALEFVGKALEKPLGRALLAVQDPLRDAGGDGVSCKQRFSTKSYFLKCKLKF